MLEGRYWQSTTQDQCCAPGAALFAYGSTTSVADRSLCQLRRSWYMLWFQAPFLPEWLSLAADCSFIEQALRSGVHAPSHAEAVFTDEDVERCGVGRNSFCALACGAPLDDVLGFRVVIPYLFWNVSARV